MALELIPNWKKFPKMISMWAYLALALAPEIYTLAAQYGVISEGTPLPEFFARSIQLIAFIGAAGRLIKQRSVEMTKPTTAE